MASIVVHALLGARPVVKCTAGSGPAVHCTAGCTTAVHCTAGCKAVHCTAIAFAGMLGFFVPSFHGGSAEGERVLFSGTHFAFPLLVVA